MVLIPAQAIEAELPAMTVSHLLTIGGLLGLVAFIVFAFRQGTKVKASGLSAHSETEAESDGSSSGCGHGADSGGGQSVDSGGGH